MEFDRWFCDKRIINTMSQLQHSQTESAPEKAAAIRNWRGKIS